MGNRFESPRYGLPVSAHSRENGKVLPPELEVTRPPWLKQVFVMFGPDGSGKTTIGKEFARANGLPIIVFGDVIRSIKNNIEDTSELAERVRYELEVNRWLSDTTINDVFVPILSKEETEEGVVIDGAMRTLEQTEAFDDFLHMAGRDNLQVTVGSVEISLAESIKRLSVRKREDDTPERIRERMADYKGDLLQRKAVWKDKYKLVNIKGDPLITEDEIPDELEGEEATEWRVWKSAQRSSQEMERKVKRGFLREYAEDYTKECVLFEEAA